MQLGAKMYVAVCSWTTEIIFSDSSLIDGNLLLSLTVPHAERRKWNYFDK